MVISTMDSFRKYFWYYFSSK